MRLRDLLHDQPMTLLDAAAYLGKITGRKPHVSTLYRWCMKGCRGIRLDSICIGGQRFVTASGLDRFIENSTMQAPSTTTVEQANPPPTSPPVKGMLAHVMRHNDRRREEIEVARRRLDEIAGTRKPRDPATRSA